MIEIDVGKIIAALDRLRQEISAERFAFVPLLMPDSVEGAIQDSGDAVVSGDMLNKILKTHKGVLAIGDSQVTLHIFEPTMPGAQDTWSYSDPKFHLCECQTLKGMRKWGRYNRYVPSKGANGVFRVRPYDRKLHKSQTERQARLKPCGYCLAQLNYKNYSAGGNRYEIRDNFNVAEFFAKYAPYFPDMPRYTADTMPQGYTPDWGDISRRRKHFAGYVCECCRANFSTRQDLLHAHHKDGNKGNNTPRNIAVVCALCHQRQPLHEEMPLRHADKDTIQQLRSAAGKPKRCPDCGG